MSRQPSSPHDSHSCCSPRRLLVLLRAGAQPQPRRPLCSCRRTCTGISIYEYRFCLERWHSGSVKQIEIWNTRILECIIADCRFLSDNWLGTRTIAESTALASANSRATSRMLGGCAIRCSSTSWYCPGPRGGGWGWWWFRIGWWAPAMPMIGATAGTSGPCLCECACGGTGCSCNSMPSALSTLAESSSAACCSISITGNIVMREVEPMYL